MTAARCGYLICVRPGDWVGSLPCGAAARFADPRDGSPLCGIHKRALERRRVKVLAEDAEGERLRAEALATSLRLQAKFNAKDGAHWLGMLGFALAAPAATERAARLMYLGASSSMKRHVLGELAGAAGSSLMTAAGRRGRVGGS